MAAPAAKSRKSDMPIPMPAWAPIDRPLELGAFDAFGGAVVVGRVLGMLVIVPVPSDLACCKSAWQSFSRSAAGSWKGVWVRPPTFLQEVSLLFWEVYSWFVIHESRSVTLHTLRSVSYTDPRRARSEKETNLNAPYWPVTPSPFTPLQRELLLTQRLLIEIICPVSVLLEFAMQPRESIIQVQSLAYGAGGKTVATEKPSPDVGQDSFIAGVGPQSPIGLPVGFAKAS
jgi:hypothetical protein